MIALKKWFDDEGNVRDLPPGGCGGGVNWPDDEVGAFLRTLSEKLPLIIYAGDEALNIAGAVSQGPSPLCTALVMVDPNEGFIKVTLTLIYPVEEWQIDQERVTELDFSLSDINCNGIPMEIKVEFKTAPQGIRAFGLKYILKLCEIFTEIVSNHQGDGRAFALDMIVGVKK